MNNKKFKVGFFLVALLAVIMSDAQAKDDSINLKNKDAVGMCYATLHIVSLRLADANLLQESGFEDFAIANKRIQEYFVSSFKSNINPEDNLYLTKINKMSPEEREKYIQSNMFKCKNASFSLPKPLVEVENEHAYSALISCGFNGQNINVFACFTETELKITKNNRSQIYNVHNLRGVGKMYQDGLLIKLPKHFQLVAQNSQNRLILGVKITDKKGNVVFEDQAGYAGIINIGN